MRFEIRHSEVWLVPVLQQSAHVILVMPVCSLSHKRTCGSGHANEKMEKTHPHRPAAFLTQKPLVASKHPRSFLDPKEWDLESLGNMHDGHGICNTSDKIAHAPSTWFCINTGGVSM